MSENKEYYIYINGVPYAVNREIYEYITKSDRKIKYAEEDRKQERYFIDYENERIQKNSCINDGSIIDGMLLCGTIICGGLWCYAIIS